MIIILRGVPGSGKSRIVDFLKYGKTVESASTEPRSSPAFLYAAQLRNFILKLEHKMEIVSADDYFMKDGKYLFDKKYLSTAHQACLRNFARLVQEPQSVIKNIIIVDNTNCTTLETTTYVNLGSAFGHEVQILTLLVDPLVAWKRNQHDVPFATIVRQTYNLQSSIAEWPSWLPQQQIFPE